MIAIHPKSLTQLFSSSSSSYSSSGTLFNSSSSANSDQMPFSLSISSSLPTCNHCLSSPCLSSHPAIPRLSHSPQSTVPLHLLCMSIHCHTIQHMHLGLSLCSHHS